MHKAQLGRSYRCQQLKKLSHKVSKPEVPHLPWRVTTETRTSGCWPTQHDGQFTIDKGCQTSQYEIQHRTGDRSLGVPTSYWQEGCVCLQRSQRKFVILMCMMIEIQDLEGVQKKMTSLRGPRLKKTITTFKHDRLKGEKPKQQKRVNSSVGKALASHANFFVHLCNTLSINSI